MLSQPGSLFQIGHMAGVEDIETTVGEDDFFSSSLPGPGQTGHFVPAEGPVVPSFPFFTGQDFPEQFLPMDRIGPHFGNHDPCRLVGQVQGISQGQSPGHSCQEHCRHRIPGPRNIEYIPGRSRFGDHFVPVDQGNPFFRPGHHHIFDMEIIPGFGRQFYQGFRFVGDHFASGFTHFLHIGGDKITAGILPPVCSLRVHQHRNLGTVGQSDHRLAEMVRTDPFGIITEDDAIQPGLEPFFQPIQQPSLFFRSQIPRFFEVQPEHLLPSPDDPHFGDGPADHHGQQSAEIDSRRRHLFFQGFPVLIGAGDPCRIDLYPQSGQVGSHVPGTPQDAFHPAHPIHRHRSFRRDPLHFPVNIPVQHHISDHRDPQFLDIFRQELGTFGITHILPPAHK